MQNTTHNWIMNLKIPYRSRWRCSIKTFFCEFVVISLKNTSRFSFLVQLQAQEQSPQKEIYWISANGQWEDCFELQLPAHYELYDLYPFLRIIHYPVDRRTKNVRTKDVHERTFIFGSIWKHGKTSQSERLMNVPMWYV